MGNTTSERVSGERHGSKSHRSDSSGGAHHTKEHPHKIMVGSTDDPSVFSSHDSKVGAGCCLCCPHIGCWVVFQRGLCWAEAAFKERIFGERAVAPGKEQCCV